MSQAGAAAHFTNFFEIMRPTLAASIFCMRRRNANATAGSFISGSSRKPSIVRFGFSKRDCLSYVVQQFINLRTHFLLRKDYFPLTLTLSPIGGEGKKWN